MSMPDLWALSLSLYIHKMGRWSLSLPICGKPGIITEPQRTGQRGPVKWSPAFSSGGTQHTLPGLP